MNNEYYKQGQQAYWRGAESPSDSPYAHAPKSEQHISWVAGWEDAQQSCALGEVPAQDFYKDCCLTVSGE